MDGHNPLFSFDMPKREQKKVPTKVKMSITPKVVVNKDQYIEHLKYLID